MTLFIPILFGTYLMSKARFSESMLEAVAFGIPAGIAIFTGLLFLLDAIFESFSLPLLYIELILFTIPIILDLVKKKYAHKSGRLLPKFNLNTYLLLAILVLTIIISSIFVFSVAKIGDTIYCIDAGCSDTLYHVGIGNSLIYSQFPPKYFFAIGTTNVYPFMNDLFSMLLNYLGFGIVASIIIPDLLLIFSFVTLSVLFTYRLTKKVGATLAATSIFWFGGTGLMKIIDYPFAAYLSRFMQPIHLIPIELSYMPHANTIQTILSIIQMSAIPITYWTTIINSMLIAQHDFMLGLPLGIAILYLLYKFVFDSGKAKFGIPELVLIGVLAGLLPLVHPATLFVVITVAIFFITYNVVIKARRKFLAGWIFIIIPFLAIAIPELLYMSLQHRSSNWFFPIYNGFVINAHFAVLTYLYTFANIIFFWVEVASLPIIFSFIGLIFAKKELKLTFLPFFILLALITIYSPMPNPADSNKIFMYVFLLLSALTGLFVEWLFRHKSIILKSLSLLIILLIIFNFALVYISDILGGMQALVSNAQMEAARFILYNTPPGAVFAENGYNSFFSPIASTIGARQTIISYNVYVGGIYKYSPKTLNNLNNEIFYNGNWSVIKEFNVSYVYLQTPNITATHAFDNANFTEVFQANDYQKNQYIFIYKVNKENQ
ncbi:MAG: hypothetical protein ACP5K5_03500 [Candidatus Micrarchaeia archaeon]